MMIYTKNGGPEPLRLHTKFPSNRSTDSRSKVFLRFLPYISKAAVLVIDVAGISYIYEPSRGKTNNVVSEQVRHKPGCTATDDLKTGFNFPGSFR